MPARDIVVIGCSVGGVEALKRLVKGLPADFPASLFIVHHIVPTFESKLADILNAAGVLPAHLANDGEPLEPGRIYIARPDYHLLLQPARIQLAQTTRENHFRPAIDPLFRSAAQHYGARVIALLLSGGGGAGDGLAGLMAVRNAGGVAIAQSPADAFVGVLPAEAIEKVGVDHVAPAAQIPALLQQLVREPSPVVREGEPMQGPIPTFVPRHTF